MLTASHTQVVAYLEFVSTDGFPLQRQCLLMCPVYLTSETGKNKVSISQQLLSY